MNTLVLNGFALSLSVDSGKLVVTNGHNAERDRSEQVFRPKQVDLPDQIIISGQSGSISLLAIKWLMRHEIPISVLNWNGELLTQMSPLQSKTAFIRMAQYQAFRDNKKRVNIAQKFIEAKIKNTQILMKWLLERYRLEKSYELCNFDRSLSLLHEANGIKNVMNVEGFIANYYWKAVSEIPFSKFEFNSRSFGKTQRPLGATDEINALFNYGYGYLSSLCLKALNLANLDPYVGFLHEAQNGKEPLVYDLQEPFRYLVDYTVISLLEWGTFNKKDFLRMNDTYSMKLRDSGAEKLVKELDLNFSKTIFYKKRNYEMASIMIMKAQELAKFLTNEIRSIDFANPQPDFLHREDNIEMRKKIKNLKYSDWKKKGYSKGSLHYMKQNVKEGKPFKVYGKVKEKIEQF